MTREIRAHSALTSPARPHCADARKARQVDTIECSRTAPPRALISCRCPPRRSTPDPTPNHPSPNPRQTAACLGVCSTSHAAHRTFPNRFTARYWSSGWMPAPADYPRDSIPRHTPTSRLAHRKSCGILRHAWTAAPCRQTWRPALHPCRLAGTSPSSREDRHGCPLHPEP
jgi:hypothetical protein